MTPDDDNGNDYSGNNNSSSARGRAFVKMFEIVDASHWTGDNTKAEIDDLRPLLLMMDIGSCASAEKHTGVNCVTASMGDVVIEHYPKIGELLELRASPVDKGNTSLNIAVSVVAHGCSGGGDGDDDENDDNDDGENDGENENRTVCTKRVCEAFFTYVTTRGPDGGKRYVPPLQTTTMYGEDAWERTLARFRKKLIRSEQSVTKHRIDYTIARHKAIFESSEVVLPSHQNHMSHLFGGVVMGWMCKSVTAACVMATRLPLTKFRIRAIQRVDFPKGAEVSDHVFLRPRITAIFDRGKSAEFEVMVGKRHVTGTSENNNNREETTMNFGYFYVSGVSTDENDNCNKYKKLSTSVAPFARLLESRKDLSTEGSTNTSRSTSSHQVHRPTNETTETTIAMAHKRKNAMLARRNLLAGMGKPVTWDSSLEVQAPLLTILSLLRLCNEYEKTSAASATAAATEENEIEGPSWKAVHTDHEGGNPSPSHSHPRIEWTYGDFWGHHNTVLICGKTVISRRKPHTTDSSSSSHQSTFLQDVYGTLCGERSKWDPFCLSVKVLEQKKINDEDDGDDMVAIKADDDDEDVVFWDVAEYEMKASNAHAMFCLLRAGSYIGEDGSVMATGLDESRNSYIVSNNNNNTIPARGVLASRSVRHEGSSANTCVLPSGFLLKSQAGGRGSGGVDDDDDANNHEYLEITYVSEHDLNGIRQSGAFGTNQVTDDYIVCFLASSLSVVLANLASMNHRAAN